MSAAEYFAHFATAIGLDPSSPGPTFNGDDALPSAFSVSDFASASIGAASNAVYELNAMFGTAVLEPVQVDTRLASQWFINTIEPKGWEIPGPWDAIAGNYQAQDGRFIRLHTNAPAHRSAALAVLGCDGNREAVQATISRGDAFELHAAIVDAGGVAAAMRSRAEWATHPQGIALSTEPLVLRRSFASAVPVERPGTGGRPLDGVRVLDLTRVLAGPVASRLLAGLGADVLRVDPLDWNEPGTVPDVNRGKRCARLNLRDAADRERFEALLASADLFVHGYRSGALDGLGYGAEWRRSMNPALVDVSLNAYGHSGPWADRRGFDSVVQVAAGIAATGMEVFGTDVPKPLPMQALDHATGYTMAACALRGWRQRLASGAGSEWRTSLAAHGELLCRGPAGDPAAQPASLQNRDWISDTEVTSWGPARRIRWPSRIPGVPLKWDKGATDHGTGLPHWA